MAYNYCQWWQRKKSQATDSQNFVAGITQKKKVIYFHCGSLEIVKKVRKAKKMFERSKAACK